MVKVPGLRNRRDLAALTQEELAARSGILRATVSRLEGGADARHSTVRKLADALGCTPADLISDTQKEPPAGV